MKKLITLFLLIISTNSFACSCNDISFEKRFYNGKIGQIEEIKDQKSQNNQKELKMKLLKSMLDLNGEICIECLLVTVFLSVMVYSVSTIV